MWCCNQAERHSRCERTRVSVFRCFRKICKKPTFIFVTSNIQYIRTVKTQHMQGQDVNYNHIITTTLLQLLYYYPVVINIWSLHVLCCDGTNTSYIRRYTTGWPLSNSSRLSVCPSAWNNSAPTGRIFVKLDIWVFFFFENLTRKFNLHWNLMRITGTSGDDLYIYIYIYIYTEWPKKMYTLFTHQYLWNKFKWNFYFRVRV